MVILILSFFIIFITVLLTLFIEYSHAGSDHYFMYLVFDTISAFGPHAALPHYRVTKKSNLSFQNNSISLS